MVFHPTSAVVVVGVQSILPISAMQQKEKLGKVEHFAAVCRSKPQNLPANLLRNQSSSYDK